MALRRQPTQGSEMEQVDMKGRYLDWIVPCDGEWRILNRVVVFDWVEKIALPPGTEAERFGNKTPIGAPYPNYPVYMVFWTDFPCC